MRDLRLLEKMLVLFQQKGWLKARGRQRTDSTHVLAKIRALNRVLCVWETMRAALNSLAVVAPDWLRAHSHPDCYQRVDDVVRWRSSENIPPPSRYIGSPYDEDAHYSKKRSTTWVGYKVHLTESCETHLPLLITHVETTSAPVSDDAMTAPIHAELARKALLPAEHIVDTGYVDAKLLVESQRDYQIDLVGPTRKNYHWQAKEQKGFDVDQ